MARRDSKLVESRLLSHTPTVRSLIPIGMASLLPDAAQRVRDLEGLLFQCFEQWGYQEIIPPTFEYLDVLSKGLPAEVLEKCYQFADWSSGRILVLRPDVTSQIARIVAMGMAGQGLPIRLCYRSTVFRYEPEHAGREREVFQVGVELIGADHAAMDAEILILLVECLKRVGLPEFTISLGHVGFYKALLARSGMSEEGCKQAQIAAARKDIPKLESILAEERVPRKDAKFILEAPGRYGQEEILKWGRSVAGRDRRLTQPTDRLTQVYQLLDKVGLRDRLLLDLGELRGFDYYDGMVFDVFSGSLGCEIGGGGRYNHLIGRFGRDLPSTGFALDVDRLFGALGSEGKAPPESQKPLLLIGLRTKYGVTFKLAQMLRSNGLAVVQEMASSLSSSALRALESRVKLLGFHRMVVLGHPSCSSSQVMVTDLVGQWKPAKRKVALTDLISLLSGNNHAHI